MLVMKLLSDEECEACKVTAKTFCAVVRFDYAMQPNNLVIMGSEEEVKRTVRNVDAYFLDEAISWPIPAGKSVTV